MATNATNWGRATGSPARHLGVLAVVMTLGIAALAMAADEAKPQKRFGQSSGFEGREVELGRAVSQAIASASPGGNPLHDFTGREAALGYATSMVVKTLNHNQGYQHEMNDALVKMTLDHIMFAKRHGMLAELVEEDLNSQRQQLERVRRLIERGGSRDLALVAIFEQTSCFFQLVDRTERAPGRVTWRSPFGTVLAETVRMGIHDLSEREIHERWTVPRMQAYAKLLGVELDVSPWRDDGMVTVSVRGGV